MVIELRQPQIVSLQQSRLDELHAPIARWIAARFPRRWSALGEERAHTWVRHGLERALALGARRRHALVGYVLLVFFLGPELEALAWARHRLSADEPVDTRIERLLSDARALAALEHRPLDGAEIPGDQ